MTELTHTKKNCTANDLCLGGADGLFCGNCGAGRKPDTKANWKDNSSSFNGKMLRAIIRVSDDEIVEASLYYSPEYTERKNEWGVTMREGTGTHRIILNSGAMRRSGVDGAFFSGGLGKSYEMAKGFKRKTLKDLQTVADRLDVASLIAASEGDYSPTLIVGGSK